MGQSQLPITNIINVSVSQAPVGAGNYNTSNLAFFTSDTPGGGFGSLGYKIYKEPTEVATDFGSGSNTAKMANAVFSQKPNILAGGGYLVVIPFEPSETLDEAITRTVGLVQYFGLMACEILSQADMLAAAAVVQPLNKIAFCAQKLAGSVAPGGSLDLLTTGGFDQTRGLLYIGTGLDIDALVFQASFAGRGLSVDFSGSNTTLTMQLKTMQGVQPDAGMTQTIYNQAEAAGADCYVSFQGVPKVADFGANKFFDQIYNQQWFAGAVQIALFNYLASVGTKVTQTEKGMDGYKGAARLICAQAVTNEYVAPGTWTSPTTFGVQQDLFDNIEQKGFYLYSLPIAQQNQADRAARKAPLLSIALKESGAIHKGNVLVNINP